MSMWLVRAGKHGENEQAALEHGLVTIGWNDLPDLSGCQERSAIAELYKQLNPDAPAGRVANEVGQVWAFRGRIETGDLVVLPLKKQAAIAIGTISGNYVYRSDLGDGIRHTRPVKWIRTDLPRTAFDQDLLYSFGAFMTVCRIQRNDAESRIQAILEGKSATIPKAKVSEEEGEESDSGIQDIELAARDQIMEYIQRKFSGHQLATLVEAVLQAEGYFTRTSPPGPDGGVDILAGSPPDGIWLTTIVRAGEVVPLSGGSGGFAGIAGHFAEFPCGPRLVGELGGLQKFGFERSPPKLFPDAAVGRRGFAGSVVEKLRTIVGRSQSGTPPETSLGIGAGRTFRELSLPMRFDAHENRSSTFEAFLKRAGFLSRAIASKWALPHSILAPSLSRRSSVKRLLFVSTTR